MDKAVVSSISACQLQGLTSQNDKLGESFLEEQLCAEDNVEHIVPKTDVIFHGPPLFHGKCFLHTFNFLNSFVEINALQVPHKKEITSSKQNICV